ncbi:urease accessory protein UreF [Methylobrevis albus]|uniref:urease accessory protein UreF n=1 Tax=Methylobrevis albus TaxID=2793297 RepID=UPI001F3A8926|nr:urease accessory UreF family protein [Methylobrevis albus]
MYRLLAWLSPAFPVGAFTYSHGLEWAIEAGDVTDAASLTDWLGAVLRHGAGWNDMILFAHAHRAAAAGDVQAIAALAELGHALGASKERRLEAGAQGRAFAEAIGKTWGSATLNALAAHAPRAPLPYAVAVAVAAADHGLPLGRAAEATLAAFSANVVSAAVRAVPLGQTDGQRVIVALEKVVAEVASGAIIAPLDAIGGAAIAADIASMRHETQYTRLFRS